jgi:DNA polymerase-3 subunit epsilon
MDNFAAIDFETANFVRSSVCSVGVVIVRDRVIRKEIYYLIKPNPNYYNKVCMDVHGLCNKDTEQAPEFPDIWAKIAPQIEGLPLVAHNSPFDEGCLKAAFELYGMDYPNYIFFCTCKAARRIIGDKIPDHRLPTVAAYCGYELENHHHALADAEACAWIAREIL